MEEQQMKLLRFEFSLERRPEGTSVFAIKKKKSCEIDSPNGNLCEGDVRE